MNPPAKADAQMEKQWIKVNSVFDAYRWDETAATLDMLIERGLITYGWSSHRDTPDLRANLRIRCIDGGHHVPKWAMLVRDSYGNFDIFSPDEFAENFVPAAPQPPSAPPVAAGEVTESEKHLLTALRLQSLEYNRINLIRAHVSAEVARQTAELLTILRKGHASAMSDKIHPLDVLEDAIAMLDGRTK